VTDDHLADPGRGEQLDEALRLGAREGPVEGLNDQLLDSRLGEELPFPRRRADERRCVVGREQARGVWLEGERAGGAAQRARRGPGRVEQAAMAQVYAVEVPDRHRPARQPACGSGDPAVDAHRRA